MTRWEDMPRTNYFAEQKAKRHGIERPGRVRVRVSRVRPTAYGWIVSFDDGNRVITDMRTVQDFAMFRRLLRSCFDVELMRPADDWAQFVEKITRC